MNPLLIILGATASGKTRLSVSVAAKLNAEIISADSRQVFRGMDIGTGKDLKEYTYHGKAVPYHLIDIMDAGEQYNVNSFQNDFYAAYEMIRGQHKPAILCGGTGMYIHSILQNHQYTAVPVNMALRERLPAGDIVELRNIISTYPEALRAQADLSSSKRLIRAIEIADFLQHNLLHEVPRPPIDPLIIGLSTDVETRRSRIINRLNERFSEGLIEEVSTLLAQGVSAEKLSFYGMEYKFITAYLQNELSLADMKEKLYIAIRQFAKRQMTFFRKMEKDGIMINWMDSTLGADQLSTQVVELYNSKYLS